MTDLLLEIKQLRQWVGWNLVDGRKVPMNPATQRAASTTDSTTWGTYEEATKAATKWDWAGYGFVLLPPYIGIDLDDCIMHGDINTFAVDVIDRCRSYTEYSPSKTGVHIIAKGNIASAFKCNEIEVYNQARYFTVTEETLKDWPITEISFDPSIEFRSAKAVEVAFNKPGWIAERLQNIVPGDVTEGRTATFSKLIGRLNHDGWNEEDVLALLAPHAAAVDFPQDKLQKQIRQMLKLYADQAPESAVALMRASDFVTEKNVQWLIKNILVEQGVTLVAGDPGSGKSFLLLDMAFSLCTGRSWMGKFDLKKGPILYIDEESPHSTLSSRLFKLASFYGVKLEDIPFYLSWKEGINLRSDSSVTGLKERLRAIQPKVVFVDSLIRVNPAEENNATDMAKSSKIVMDLAKEFEFGWVFLDHLPHANMGIDAKRRMRGSTEKKAYISNSFLVTPIGKNAFFEPDKHRDGDSIQPFEFQIQDAGSEAIQLKYIG